jgi:hypothetical protein
MWLMVAADGIIPHAPSFLAFCPALTRAEAGFSESDHFSAR